MFTILASSVIEVLQPIFLFHQPASAFELPIIKTLPKEIFLKFEYLSQ